jgi:hypothetical protein
MFMGIYIRIPNELLADHPRCRKSFAELDAQGYLDNFQKKCDSFRRVLPTGIDGQD